ncbi:MAG: MazG nucleotide pyrophosphohydrolase domain-containing protein [Nanobdellota archaeon]
MEELKKIMKLDRNNSEWGQSYTFRKAVDELRSEIDEIQEALDKKDYDNLKEELGDALGDLMYLSIIAEEEGHFKFEDTVKSIAEKMKRRKPWLMEGKTLPLKEEQRLWEEIKKKDKEKKNKS